MSIYFIELRDEKYTDRTPSVIKTKAQKQRLLFNYHYGNKSKGYRRKSFVILTNIYCPNYKSFVLV